MSVNVAREKANRWKVSFLTGRGSLSVLEELDNKNQRDKSKMRKRRRPENKHYIPPLKLERTVPHSSPEHSAETRKGFFFSLILFRNYLSIDFSSKLVFLQGKTFFLQPLQLLPNYRCEQVLGGDFILSFFI